MAEPAASRSRRPHSRLTGAARKGQPPPRALLGDDPLWYMDAVIYELHVKSFADSDGDGIGDFAGATARLDYLQDLGVTALWILPFYPSPLRDDGYDIADYWTVNPTYGTMEEFQRFLDEAHRRGLRVITELVINHTSDQHPWFQRARRAPRGTVERDFYVWSDDPDRYRETRIIFKDYEPSNWTWDPVAAQYFWHRFFHHQPDLNFDNPAVQEELFRVLDYWLEMGVDGLRLDAIPYLYEREGTNCENLPETHVFLKKLRAHVEERFDNRLLLAEANQWPEDAAEYFGDGDECHMNFHFPIMPRLFMALRMEDRFPIQDILEQTPEIPEGTQWAIFLRNHDELTLEMVTDEERDYMYRVYAHDTTARINLGIRRRLAPLLENSRRKIELMNSLLLSLPGTPVLYYGDEIGMGDNFYLGDRHGVRTPMQWSGDRNAGFSTANPQRLFLPVIIDPEYHYESLNVEAQHLNPSSLLWWTRRIIALRQQHKAFGRGSFEWIDHDNKRVLAFLREWDGDRILVVANLSRFAQAVALDLTDHRGGELVELFGRTRFPAVTGEPYPLTLGPHTFYWFRLRSPEDEAGGEGAGLPSVQRLPLVTVSGSWEEALVDPALGGLNAVLEPFLRRQRWFAGKGLEVRAVEVADVVPVPLGGQQPGERDDGAEGGSHPRTVLLTILRVTYIDGDDEHYVLPLAWEPMEAAERRADRAPATIVCRVGSRHEGGRGDAHDDAREAAEGEAGDGGSEGGADVAAGGSPGGSPRDHGQGEGVLFDAAGLPAFARLLLELVESEGRVGGAGGRLEGVLDGREALDVPDLDELDVKIGSAEQSNTSILFGQSYILKLFRRIEEGLNLDREVGRFLTDHGFEHTPAVAGGIEYRRRRTTDGARSASASLAVLQTFVPNEGDAWEFTLDALGRYLEQVQASSLDPDDLPVPSPVLVEAAAEPIPDRVHEIIGEAYLDNARLLGQRTGELHACLASASLDSGGQARDFLPEAFTRLYQRSLYQSMRNLLGHTFRALERGQAGLEGVAAEEAQGVLQRRSELLARFRRILDRKLSGSRIRVHGDYHLGQVLYTGKDFVIIDFEGEPARPLSERRLKRSPLRDVAGMLRSFHYASRSALFHQREQGADTGRAVGAAAWAAFWYRWVSAAFLKGYFETVGDHDVLPAEASDQQLLLEVFLLEKALYELAYEVNNRPGWVRIPLEGILDLIGMPEAAAAPAEGDAPGGEPEEAPRGGERAEPGPRGDGPAGAPERPREP